MTNTRRQFVKSLTLLPVAHWLSKSAQALAKAKPVSGLRICFGSCNNQKESQDFWHHIADQNPDIWLCVGDNIYADDANYSERVKAYSKVKKSPGYMRLKESAIMNATWDDHDYAYNNAGAEYSRKADSKKAFLEFLEEPEGSPRWEQEGIYTSWEVKDIEFLLLDLRYFKPDNRRSQDLLGPKQWAWLEERLTQSQAKMIVICSSVQMLCDFDGKETWYRYRDSYERVKSLIEKANRPVMVFSGDRHFYEVSQRRLDNGHDLVEITSSGLTHMSDRENKNSYRVGEVKYEKNFCVLDVNFDDSGIAFVARALSPDDGRLIREDRWSI